MSEPVSARAGVVPELGPLLGRLTDSAVMTPRTSLGLDDIRYALVTELFDLGAKARALAVSGDVAGAASALGRRGWLEAWERAVSAVAQRVADRADARLRAAAAESRMPAKQLDRLLLDEEERRSIGLRLGVAGGPFVAALDALEAAGPAGWQDALGHVARRLEVAWDALVRTAAEEEAAWTGEADRVRAWRRTRWPLWVITAAVLAAAIYLGLVLGGFVTVPEFLRPLADYWWSR
jgi:hypothetical protein